MPKEALSFVLQSWEILVGALKRNAAALVHLQEGADELAEVRRQTLRLKTEHQKLQAQVLTASRRLQESIQHGKGLESRLRNALKGVYGGGAEQLIQFGIQPRRESRRKKREEGEGEKREL